jgi:hypothetical protein
MNKGSGSAPTACNVLAGGNDRADVFMRSPSGTGILHDWWDSPNAEWADQNQAWDSSANGDAASLPGVVCRDSAVQHDMVIYNLENNTVQHNQWNITWKGWHTLGGSFVGDPVVVSPSSSRFDFFGLGTDKAIWHFSWNTTAGYSDLESLGGEFESVPSVVATSSDRLDIVAVGTDDKLKHRAYIGMTPSPVWDDLGEFSNSAPLLVSLGGDSISVFAIGRDNDLLSATWTISDDETWTNLSNFTSVGGNLTTTWFK